VKSFRAPRKRRTPVSISIAVAGPGLAVVRSGVHHGACRFGRAAATEKITADWR
jgi:hypothetical protein